MDEENPLLGLWMVVKNESAVIERCLLSVYEHIDWWTIVDTGSSDGTQEIVRGILDEIPGELHERDWVDFGHNRTEALGLVRDRARWILRMDADWELADVHPHMWEWLGEDAPPETDSYLVEIMDAGTHYRLPVLNRGGLDWRYVGETHEYLDPAGRMRQNITGLRIVHHADGANRVEKHLRDIRLLSAGVENGDSRAIFYTAQALACLGKAEEAATMYDRRARMNGWEEESWYAQYQAARLRRDVAGLLEAYRRRPWRHEPLRAAAALVALDNRDDVLFIERS